VQAIIVLSSTGPSDSFLCDVGWRVVKHVGGSEPKLFGGAALDLHLCDMPDRSDSQRFISVGLSQVLQASQKCEFMPISVKSC
jgi:hypothetical protein